MKNDETLKAHQDLVIKKLLSTQRVEANSQVLTKQAIAVEKQADKFHSELEKHRIVAIIKPHK